MTGESLFSLVHKKSMKRLRYRKRVAMKTQLMNLQPMLSKKE